MDPQPLLWAVLCASQVYGSPTFYWSQPDCYQQNVDYPSNSYESFQGPSYQETLREMLAETLRAISEIAQVTARATKQELSALAKIFYQNIRSGDCNTPDYTGEDSEDYQLNDSSGPAQFQGQFEVNPPVEPQNQPQAESEVPVSSTEKELSPVSGKPPSLEKTGSEGNKTIPDSSQNTKVGNVSPLGPQFPAVEKMSSTGQPTSARPNFYNKTRVDSNITSTSEGFQTNFTSTVSPLMNRLATPYFTTPHSASEVTTEIDSLSTSTTDELTMDSTTAEYTSGPQQSPKHDEIFNW